MPRRATTTASTREHGVTVIELAVVLALFGVMMLVAVPSLRAVFGSDLRGATLDLASTIRYVQDEAVLRNMTMRLAYDLDGNTWWIEAADGPVRMFRDRDAKQSFEEFLADKAESDEQVREDAENRKGIGPSQSDIMAQLFGGEEGGMDGASPMGGLLGGLFGGGGGLGPAARGGEYQPNQFTPIGGTPESPDEDNEAFVLRRFPESVRFLGVWTPESEEPVEPLDEFEREAMSREAPEDQRWTTVYSHIFPGRYSEDTVIYLSDESGSDIWSIRIEPLTGIVKVEKGRIDLPDLSDREQRQ